MATVEDPNLDLLTDMQNLSVNFEMDSLEKA